MADAFLESELTAIEASIVKARTAIDAVSAGAQSYTYDTGQDRVVVTRANLDEIKRTLDWLYRQRRELRQQLGLDSVGRVVRILPSF